MQPYLDHAKKKSKGARGKSLGVNSNKEKGGTEQTGGRCLWSTLGRGKDKDTFLSEKSRFLKKKSKGEPNLQ